MSSERGQCLKPVGRCGSNRSCVSWLFGPPTGNGQSCRWNGAMVSPDSGVRNVDRFLRSETNFNLLRIARQSLLALIYSSATCLRAPLGRRFDSNRRSSGWPQMALSPRHWVLYGFAIALRWLAVNKISHFACRWLAVNKISPSAAPASKRTPGKVGRIARVHHCCPGRPLEMAKAADGMVGWWVRMETQMRLGCATSIAFFDQKPIAICCTLQRIN